MLQLRANTVFRRAAAKQTFRYAEKTRADTVRLRSDAGQLRADVLQTDGK